ncbi:MAG: alkyl sulfatase dimerization domain-containing protein [Acidimicrobiales bacterium]|jgi:alkyl sulfatase BDS1-like metallo-beta-lactamase superfamily hydrolase
MGDDVLELADKLWRGEIDIVDIHPVGGYIGGLAEIGPGVAFVPSFANVSAFSTDDGLVLVDTGSSFVAQAVHDTVRQWSPQRLHTAVYSHGHIDHVFGVPVWEEESAARGWPAPTVVAHDALPARFDRYIATAGYNEIINQRQFQVPGLRWPTEYRYPDRTYADRLSLEVGGAGFELHHARGETDDHTWTWVPGARALCCGDLFIWASPNAGNPQKVQRYPKEWAAALREMVALEPEVLLPGHGFPVVGAGRVRQALSDTAELLDSLVDQAVALMNAGARLDEVIHGVTAPAHLMDRPYLRPVYDEPEFVVRNVWRLYGGWWDGNPATLKPAPEGVLAAELATLAGGAGVLADRAAALVAGASADVDPAASLRLAGHLAELAALAAPADAGVHRTRAEVFAAMAEAATSTMAKGVFSWTARDSRTRSGDGD